MCNSWASKHWMFKWHIKRNFGGYKQFRERLQEVTIKRHKWNFISKVTVNSASARKNASTIKYNNGWQQSN